MLTLKGRSKHDFIFGGQMATCSSSDDIAEQIVHFRSLGLNN
jgi:hypothetical protein